ncbi:MAG TPA: helix-turn-helix transcriptional regulator [Dehalococcoidia bacterium]|nr:helix-turn-helix transcriptional regulator [Dehalococcoidia bacterium]
MTKETSTQTEARANGTRSGSARRAKSTAEPRLSGDLLSSSLLAFLRKSNQYGYALVQELAKAGLPDFDSTTVYRTLRQLEKAGLVSSFWDTSESGPARRRYAVTNAGEMFLDAWYEIFGKYQKVLQSAWETLDNREAEKEEE